MQASKKTKRTQITLVHKIIYTVVWEKFNGVNIHEKKFKVKNFSSQQAADENFLMPKIFAVIFLIAILLMYIYIYYSRTNYVDVPVLPTSIRLSWVVQRH